MKEKILITKDNLKDVYNKLLEFNNCEVKVFDNDPNPIPEININHIIKDIKLLEDKIIIFESFDWNHNFYSHERTIEISDVVLFSKDTFSIITNIYGYDKNGDMIIFRFYGITYSKTDINTKYLLSLGCKVKSIAKGLEIFKNKKCKLSEFNIYEDSNTFDHKESNTKVTDIRFSNNEQDSTENIHILIDLENIDNPIDITVVDKIVIKENQLIIKCVYNVYNFINATIYKLDFE